MQYEFSFLQRINNGSIFKLAIYCGLEVVLYKIQLCVYLFNFIQSEEMIKRLGT